MPDVGEVLAHGGGDADFAQLSAHGTGELTGVVVGAVRSAEAGHGHRDDAVARKSQQVEGAHGHEQGERGVQAAREADHRAARVRVRKTLGEAVSLNGKDVLAALRAAGGVGRHEGVRVHPACERGLAGGGIGTQREGHSDVAQLLRRRGALEGGHARALGHEEADVDLRDGAAVAEGLALREQATILGHEVVPGEDEVLRGLARAGARVDVAAEQARALAGHEAAAVVRLADDGVGGAQVADQRGAGLRVRDRGRRGNPEVLADLRRDHELGELQAGEEQVGAHGHVLLVRDGDGDGVDGAGDEVAPLVELVVGGDVGLGHKAEDHAARDGGGAVVELAARAHGHAHEQQRVEVCRGGGKVGEAGVGGADEGILPEEVLAGVAGERELGKHDDDSAVLLGSLTYRRHAGLHVEGDVRDPHLRRHRRDLDEPVPHPNLLMMKRDSPFSSSRRTRNGVGTDAGQPLDLPHGQTDFPQLTE